MKIESLLICGNIAYTNKKSKRGNEKCVNLQIGCEDGYQGERKIGKWGVRVG